MLRQIKPLILCFLSGIILTLPFSNGKLWLLSWFGFLPLFVALKDKSKFQAFLLSYFTGIIFWLGSIWWLVHVTLAGTILLILYLALYFGLFGFFASTYLLSTNYSLLLIPSIWVLLEYLRSHLLTGFPWALLGYSQYLNLSVLQIADITGVWGVSFLITMVNVAIAEVLGVRFLVLGQKDAKIKPGMMIWCFLLLSLAIIYGYYKLNLTPLPVPAHPAGWRQAGNTQDRTPIKISVIQGNIPQDLKWDKDCRDFIITQYINLSRQAMQDKPDLLIWPEAALPVVLEEEPLYYEMVRDLVREIKVPVLLGVVTLRNNLYYNSSVLVSGGAEILDIYDKLHLVPFGEYIPLRKTLWFLQTIVPIGDITAGRVYKVFDHPAKFSVLICFEDLFPELSRRFVNKGARFLVNITNDAWYKKTPASYQHLQASVLRAVENRVFLVRSANTGVSGFITPAGEIISLVEKASGQNIFISGYKTETIFTAEHPTLSFYRRFGDIFILCLLLFSLYGILRSIRSAHVQQ